MLHGIEAFLSAQSCISIFSIAFGFRSKFIILWFTS